MGGVVWTLIIAGVSIIWVAVSLTNLTPPPKEGPVYHEGFKIGLVAMGLAGGVLLIIGLVLAILRGLFG